MKTLIANWKANPASLKDAEHLFHETMKVAKHHPNVSVVICPPFVYVPRFGSHAAIQLGAQDAFWESGPHTGQVSVAMLAQFGVSHVLVGHSERRALGETDEQINKKLKAVLSAGMTPVLLIGEPEKNDAVRQDILIDQLTRDLESVGVDDALKILYCFEPAWAISTTSGNKAESLENIIAGVQMMRDILTKMYQKNQQDFPMLYGASVNGENCNEILSRPELQGAVVGGASIRADEFARMIEIVSKL